VPIGKVGIAVSGPFYRCRDNGNPVRTDRLYQAVSAFGKNGFIILIHAEVLATLLLIFGQFDFAHTEHVCTTPGWSVCSAQISIDSTGFWKVTYVHTWLVFVEGKTQY
jgi:hypothetical protein